MADNPQPNQEPQQTREQDECLVYAFPAQVITRSGRGNSAADLLTLAKETAPDPDALDETPPYFFAAQISNGAIDAYFTRMHRSTLENFANEATEGRAFLEGHNTRTRPIGYSLRGRYVGASAAGKARCEADFYTTPEPSGVGRKADLIQDIKTGLQRDVSVGFNLGEDGIYRCDLCKRDYMGGECPHWLGTRWNFDTHKEEEQICTCAIENGHLNEVSAVYDGATPGAAIIKAIRAMEEGRMTPEMARVLEPMYRVKLAGPRTEAPRVWAGVGGGTLIGDGDRYDGQGIVSTAKATKGQILFPPREGASDRGRLSDVPVGSTTALAGSLDIDALLNVAVYDRGLEADRGDPGISQRLYIATDSNRIFYDDGKEWQSVLISSGSLASDNNGRKERAMPDQDPITSDTGQNTAPPPAAPPPEPETRTQDPPAFTAPAEPTAERAPSPSEWTAEQYAERVNAVLAGSEVPGVELAECVRRLSAECVTLRPLATDGRAYREALVGDVLHQAARAAGKDYDEAFERELCAGMTTAQLVQQHNRYKKIADALFPAGRVTSDNYEPEPTHQEPVTTPQSAYRV